MTKKPPITPPENDEEGKPPVFKSWNGWYMLLLGTLGTLVLLFYWFSKHFS